MQQRFFKNTILSLSVVTIYAFSLLVNKSLGINLIFLPAGLLLLWLPGKMILDFFPTKRLKFNYWGNLALEIFVSFTLIVSLQILVVSLRQSNFVAETIIINFILALLSLCLYLLIKYKKISQITGFYIHEFNFPKFNKNDLPVLAIPLAIIFLMYLIDPISRDNDGFLTALKDYVTTGEITKQRPEFMRYLGLAATFLNLNYLFVFKICLVLLFYISTFFAFDYLDQQKHDRKLKYLSYLSFISAPVLLTEANIIRPQLGTIVYTIPVLIMLVMGLERRDIYLLGVAFWFSFISISFHELSFLLFLIAAVSVAYFLLREIFFYKKKYLIKKILLFLVVAYPYSQTQSFGKYFVQVGSGMALIKRFVGGFKFDWWFIDSYRSVDGKELGWPGILSVQYYLYNGLLFLAIGFFLFCVRKKPLLNKSRLLPPLLYAAVYFSIAEILPRMGCYFLPNRAWVHLMLGFYVLFMVFISEINIDKYYKGMVVALKFIILLGFVGTLYVAKNNVSNFTKDELAISNFLKKSIPDNSLVLSSQENEAIVKLYGQKEYSYLEVKPDDDKESLKKILEAKLLELSKPQIIEFRPETKHVTTTVVDKQIVSTKEIVYPAEKISLPPIYNQGEPAYFLYSYQKLKGMNAHRTYLVNSLDAVHKDYYSDLGFPIVAKTDVFLLIKIK